MQEDQLLHSALKSLQKVQLSVKMFHNQTLAGNSQSIFNKQMGTIKVWMDTMFH